MVFKIKISHFSKSIVEVAESASAVKSLLEAQRANLDLGTNTTDALHTGITDIPMLGPESVEAKVNGNHSIGVRTEFSIATTPAVTFVNNALVRSEITGVASTGGSTVITVRYYMQASADAAEAKAHVLGLGAGPRQGQGVVLK